VAAHTVAAIVIEGVAGQHRLGFRKVSRVRPVGQRPG